jgi:hypothetical protein
VAPFLAAASGYSLKGFMDLPIFERSPWPIAVDLNQYLYLPESNVKLDKEQVLAGDLSNLKMDEKTATLRYRGFIQLLFEQGPGEHK